jgi:sirohydrochlorin cobaltochelatase
MDQSKNRQEQPKSALILFAHGARDPRWAAPFQRLQQLTQAQLPDAEVALAFLELMTPQLPALVPQLVLAGCTDIMIAPVFLGQGGHVLRDLPLLMAQLQADYPAVRIRSCPAVGEDAQVLQAIAHYCVAAVGHDGSLQ